MPGRESRPGRHGPDRAEQPHGRHAGPGEVAAEARREATHGRHVTRDATADLLEPVMYRPVRVAAPPPSGRVGIAVQVLVAMVLGVVTVSAVSALRAPRPSDVSARELLVTQIQERADEVEALAADNRALDDEVTALQDELLGTTDRGLLTFLDQTSLLAGSTAVAGPGLVVELDDPDAPDSTLSAESRVQDVDVQIVVNSLRASGAEAVAVNGHRLTALSAIRAAGQAIFVDLTPLIAPYRIEAIGDVRAMQAQFARSPAASHLTLLRSAYQITSSVRTADRLHLPGASTTTLRYASALGGVTSSDGADEEGAP